MALPTERWSVSMAAGLSAAPAAYAAGRPGAVCPAVRTPGGAWRSAGESDLDS